MKNRNLILLSYQKYFYSFVKILLIISFACIHYACSNSNVEKQLSEAESLIIERPDSTISLLVQMDTTRMSKNQIARQELLFLYTQLIYGNQIPIDSAGIAEGDEFFVGKLNSDEIKWLIVKSAEAHRSGNPIARIELLKDAEFLAIQSDDKPDLGIVYFFLSKVYEQGFNGIVSKYYADKALAIFKDLIWQSKIRDTRMAIVGAYCVDRDYKTALDSLIAMQPEVMANAHDGYKIYFLDQLARSYDEDGQSTKAIEIWHSIYDSTDVSANTLAHWARAYWHINELDSAYMLIQQANALPHNNSDEYLCRNVEYAILEKMGRKHELERIDSLRAIASNKIGEERHLEETSLALNIKYDSATRLAWLEASKSRNRAYVAILITLLTVFAAVAIYIFLKKRNRLLQLEHENDILKIESLQDNLFKSDSRNNDMSIRVSELFKTRFNLMDGLASAYFECKDSQQEQKRIYSEVKRALSNFGTKEAIDELTEIVNGYKNNLMEHFKTDYPKMSPAQYKTALYLFCGFSLPAISIFTDTEIRNLYVYKSRLKSAISKSETPRKEEYLQYFE
ncbi:MAG: hypothetical protein HDS72_10155 [Bacteroidales bacterium]|nr:hypothetical protein [Bacteroidales bacterium]